MNAPDRRAELVTKLRRINAAEPGQRQDYVYVVGLISAIVDLPSRTDAAKLEEIRQTIDALRLSRRSDRLGDDVEAGA
jgi:hypothetical protein